MLALISRWDYVCSEAARPNLAAVDLLVDWADALDQAFLSDRERYIIELVTSGGWDVAEAAGIADCDEDAIKTRLVDAATKIATYIGDCEDG